MNGTPEAIPFITTSDEGEFLVDDRAVQYLEEIEGRIAIIAVAGPWRTGKSFLLNQFLGIENSGFVVGPTINACTKGIWLWGQPVVLEDGLNVVLMDTEGLGSTSRSQTEDCNIFSLALLLSSYFVWNSRGVIDGNALEDFALVVNITKHIHVRSQAVQSIGNSSNSSSEVEQLSQYFPSFMWVVRDFTLKLEENGRAISDRQYLEKALKPQGGFSEDAASRNQIRHLLSSFFNERDCTTLVRPAEDETVLRNLMKTPLENLRPEFVKAVMHLKKKVFGTVRPKHLHGRMLTGPMISTLAQAYASSINTGGAPTIATAWERVLESQAEQAVSNALRTYEAKLESKLMIEHNEKGKLEISGLLEEIHKLTESGGSDNPLALVSALPIEDDKLVSVHEECAREAVEEFIKGSWGEEMKEALSKSLLELRRELGERLSYLSEANRSVSEAFSTAVATQLFSSEIPKPYSTKVEKLRQTKGEEFQIEHELDMGQDWLLSVCDGLIRFRDQYMEKTKGPMRWAVFSNFLGDQVLALMVGWGQGVGGAQRRACGGLRALVTTLEREKEAAMGRLSSIKQQEEQLVLEGQRAAQDRESRCEHEKNVVNAQIEAIGKQLQQSQDFLTKLEAAHELVSSLVNAQCDMGKALADDMRDTLGRLQSLPAQSAQKPAWGQDGSDNESDGEETTVWDIKAQVSAAETELRMLRQEIELKEQHLEANMRTLDLKEQLLREVEYKWGMTKATSATEVDDLGEVEEETACLYRIIKECKDYLSWTSAFGRLPGSLTGALTESQKEILDEV